MSRNLYRPFRTPYSASKGQIVLLSFVCRPMWKQCIKELQEGSQRIWSRNRSSAFECSGSIVDGWAVAEILDYKNNCH